MDISQVVHKYGGEDPREYSYGETPTITVNAIADLAALSRNSRIVDLGFGRGLPVLAWTCLGFRGAGVELIPEYTERALATANRLGLDVDLRTGDILTADWPEGELYFINSTAFGESFREKLREKLLDLPADSQVATYDWELGEGFQETNQQRLPVTWGTVVCRIFRKLGEA